MNIQQHISLKSHTTFGIEAFADYWIEIQTEQDLLSAFEFRQKHSLNLMILGGGSNILLTQDFSGLILHNSLKGIRSEIVSPNEVLVEVSAGENWHAFVQHCIANNWGGLENLSLIPGSVGASPMQNIGAYGREIKDTFYSLRAMDIQDGTVHVFDAQQCKFGYRESIFKHEAKGRFIILSATFKLTSKEHQITTSYGAISQELEKMGIQNPSIRDVSNAVIAIRKSKLPDPAVIGNAGSFFKNPVVTNDIVEKIRSKSPNVVSYPAGENHSKLAAGWLIEAAGWKGFRRGDAGVHALQALVLVNYGNATGKEIWQLSQDVVDDVASKFGVQLEREVNIV